MFKKLTMEEKRGECCDSEGVSVSYVEKEPKGMLSKRERRECSSVDFF